eukprot:9358684-Prorocentrum_lima.AAC.1
MTSSLVGSEMCIRDRSCGMSEGREAKLFPCFRCDSLLPFFKMVESWRPEHALDASDLTFDED